MLISVIIPTCHRNDLLALCLDRLAPGKQTGGVCMQAGERQPENESLDSAGRDLTSDLRPPTSDILPTAFTYEVIVSDDGLQSTAEALIQQNYPWAKWVAGPRRGPAANRNNGAKLAQGDWLVFTDDDCLPGTGFIGAFAKEVIKNIAPVLEGKTMPLGRRTRVDMECPINEAGGRLWSCNMAIKKTVFFEFNGFDTGFPGPAMEDTDLQTRLIKARQKIDFVPEALVLHPWRVRNGLCHQRLHARSLIYYATKHPEAREGLRLRILLVGLARRLLKQIPSIAIQCRGRGLLREVCLNFSSLFIVLKTCKQTNLRFF